MKQTKYLALCLVLAVSYLCFAVEPPGIHAESAAFVSAKSELPTNNGFTAAESVVLFVAAVSAVALVSRRTVLAVKTKFRAFAKTFVALAKSGVQKLTENHRRSNSKHDESFAMIGAGSGDAPIGSGSGG